jgi:hypothetical protein
MSEFVKVRECAILDRSFCAVQQVDHPLIVGSSRDDLFARRPEEDGMFKLSRHRSAQCQGNVRSHPDDRYDIARRLPSLRIDKGWVIGDQAFLDQRV